MNINRFPAIKTHKNRRFMQLNQTVINYSGPTLYAKALLRTDGRLNRWTLPFTTDLTFLKTHGLVASMSRRGNCYDNAVAESFFQLLKRERVRRKTYLDREEARREIFDYIEMFYNPKRRHGYANGVSPVEFENQYFNRLQSV